MVSHRDLTILTLTLAVCGMKKTKEEKRKALVKRLQAERSFYTRTFVKLSSSHRTRGL